MACSIGKKVIYAGGDSRLKLPICEADGTLIHYHRPYDFGINPADVKPGDFFIDPKMAPWGLQHFPQLYGKQGIRISRGNGPVLEFPRTIADINQLRVSDFKGGETSIESFLHETDTTAFLVLHKGRLVSEQYFQGMSRDTKHAHFSCGKAVFGSIATMLIEQGRLNRSDKIVDLVPDLKGTAYEEATIDHALKMGTGVAIMGDAKDMPVFLKEQKNLSERTKRLLAGTNTWLHATGLYGPECGRDAPKGQLDMVRKAELDHPHGEYWFYKEADPWVVMRAMENVTGEAYPEIASRLLWSKLGARTDAWIMRDGRGSPYPAAGFASTPSDLARWGALFAKEGRNLNGEHVLPRAVADSLTRYSREPSFFENDKAQIAPQDLLPQRRKNYGYNAYLSLHPEFVTAMGALGQNCQISRERETVIVKMSAANMTAPRFHEGAFAETQREELIFNEISKAIVALHP